MEQKKRIRIFISSTFKDMQKERDIIVQEVLLPLRAEAERRGGSLSWVDLRWGIRPGTDTEMVIRTCLSEIEDCHPFFIGLVGHRYGWSPTINGKLEERLNRQFRDTEELFSHKRSLTEIEMRYNLLLSKEKGRNYFYFSGDTPKISILGRILRYCINRGKEPSLIADLRTYIKDEYKRNVPEYSIMCNQDDKRHLKKLVYADIKHIVDEIFPETPVPEAMAVRYHQENFYNAQDGFLSRERILTEIRDWIDTPLAKDDSKMKCLLLKGNSGVGKTTMLATLLHNSSHNIKFLYHFVGASMKRESPVLILRDLLNQTYSKEELSSLTKNVSDNIYELCDILQQRILNDVKAKVIVVIDNIDAIECSKETLVSLFDWLPTKLPNTKYILSSSSEWRHLKGDLSPVDMTELIIPELTIIERKDYASIFLVKEYRKDINQGKRFSDLLLDERNQYLSNPRMLKMFLDEISILGLYGDELDKKVKQITCDSSQLLDNIFNRLEKKTCGIAKVRKILLSIALTDYGLQENDIVDICNDEKVKLKPEDWSILHWNIKPYLQNNGSIAFQKFFRDAVLHRYSNDENMSKEQLRLAQRLEFMYKEQNRHYESEFLNLYSKSNEDDLYRCLADPHILSYLYNNDKDKLFDYLLQLKKHGYIDYFTKDIVASVSTLTEEEKIEIFEMLSTIFCNIIPIYTVAIDAEENTIKILEAKNDFSVEGKKRLAQNYLNEVKLLTIVFKLLEAEASYKRFRDYISSIEIGDEYEALYYDGLVAQANIYYAHPDFEEKKKAIPLYKMTITYFEGKGIYIKTIDLLYNLAMLCGYNGDNNTLSECNMRLKEIVSTHCKYGSHLYFASLYKQMDCERLLLPTSGYEDYIKRLKNQIDNIKDMYGGVCNEICEFYLNIGTEYDAIARSYWKEKNIPMFIANAKETESYYGLFLETVEKLHETDSKMYADGLHSYAKSFQNFISISPLFKHTYIKQCLDLYMKEEIILKKLFPDGHWDMAKMYHNMSDCYAKLYDYIKAEEYIEKSITIKKQLLPLHFETIFNSEIRQISILMKDLATMDFDNTSKLSKLETLISCLRTQTESSNELNHSEKEKRLKEIEEYVNLVLQLQRVDMDKRKIANANLQFIEIRNIIEDYNNSELNDLFNNKLLIVFDCLFSQWEKLHSYIRRYNLQSNIINSKEFPYESYRAVGESLIKLQIYILKDDKFDMQISPLPMLKRIKEGTYSIYDDFILK